METTAFRLPGVLAEIEEVAGREAAISVATSYGGRKLKFPTRDSLEEKSKRSKQNWLVKTVGHRNALAICREFFPFGGTVDIPSARNVLRRQYVYENATKLSQAELSSCLDISERAVRRIKSQLRDEGLLE
ncbi:hypothetical protein [Novosphingobium sp. BW1]|uniref:hypothetical protein n=1 Tax=Novosphingobium sp. BW1 TaxID=2592621 RepID=UPI0011DE6239|nr:hypothetical protein [Novosphingobium sp. BW1]TYC93548.1 hypothetical protein FMM79_01220 [Novosphingobium sp. BW1]